MVGFEPEAFVGLDRIQPLVLQFVSLQLGHQADAAALLLLIDQNARALLGDHRQRHFQLCAAVAAQRAENVSGQALGMDAEQRRGGVDVAHDQGDGILITGRSRRAEVSAKTVDAEFAPASREVG